MKDLNKNIRLCLSIAIASATVIIAGCAGGMMMGSSLTMTGAQEVPPVTSSASAKSTVTVATDHTVSGTITTTGITATAAHIHMAPTPGANGPVIVPMKKTGDNVFTIADGAKLTDEQYAAYKAGRLYVNVHSAANPGGELRANMPGN